MSTAHDDMFGRVRTKQPPRSKRRIMREFILDEISLVDRPAQEGCTAVLTKGARFAKSYDRAKIATAAAAATEEREQAEEHEFAALSRRYGTGGKGADRRDLRDTEDMDLDEGGEEEDMAKDGDMGDEETAAAAARLRSLLDEDEDEEGEEFEKEPTDEREGDWPPGSDDPIAGETHGTRADGYASGDEAALNAVTARLMRQDRSLSKRRAEVMASARLYDVKVFNARAAGFAKGVGMPPRAVMGREREQRRRVIEQEVAKLRKADPYMPHRQATAVIKQAYPWLFS